MGITPRMKLEFQLKYNFLMVFYDQSIVLPYFSFWLSCTIVYSFPGLMCLSTPPNYNLRLYVGTFSLYGE